MTENFVCVIAFKKTRRADFRWNLRIAAVSDFILWYAKIVEQR